MDREEGMGIKAEPQHLLQHEFSIIAFVDYLTERPFEFIYQEKIVQQFQATIMGDLVSARPEIRDSWVDNRVDDSISQIVMRTEEIARENGLNQSLRKQTMKITLPIMVGFFVFIFVAMIFISNVMIYYIIFIPMMLIMCFLPRVIQQRFMGRWQRFAQELAPTIKGQITGAVERLKKFVQFLINDVRKILIENKLDFANYQLILLNPDYQNVKVLQERIQRNVKFFIVELLPMELEESLPKPDESVEKPSRPIGTTKESYEDEFKGY